MSASQAATWLPHGIIRPSKATYGSQSGNFFRVPRDFCVRFTILGFAADRRHSSTCTPISGESAAQPWVLGAALAAGASRQTL
jgi:hypothetical protein